MSFTMQNIKRKSTTKIDNIKACYGYIKSSMILTDNVKLAIWKYCDYRYKQRCCGNLSIKSLENMINELLEKICLKSIKDININDVMKNENEILYHIKRAIFYGATKSLYYDIDEQKTLNKLYSSKTELLPPKSRK